VETAEGDAQGWVAVAGWQLGGRFWYRWKEREKTVILM
jgi:hypothetical protein